LSHDALCGVIDEYFNYYGAAVSLPDGDDDDDDDDYMAIQFETSAIVVKGTYFNPYTNRRLPGADEMFPKMTNLLANHGSIGPLAAGSIELFTERLGGTLSPYSTQNVTMLSISNEKRGDDVQ